MMTQTQDKRNDKTQEAIDRQVEYIFESASRYDAVIPIIVYEMYEAGIYFPIEGYRGVPHIVILDLGTDKEKTNRFPSIADAFRYAFNEYKNRIVQSQDTLPLA